MDDMIMAMYMFIVLIVTSYQTSSTAVVDEHNMSIISHLKKLISRLAKLIFARRYIKYASKRLKWCQQSLGLSNIAEKVRQATTDQSKASK